MHYSEHFIVCCHFIGPVVLVNGIVKARIICSSVTTPQLLFCTFCNSTSCEILKAPFSFNNSSQIWWINFTAAKDQVAVVLKLETPNKHAHTRIHMHACICTQTWPFHNALREMRFAKAQNMSINILRVFLHRKEKLLMILWERLKFCKNSHQLFAIW